MYALEQALRDAGAVPMRFGPAGDDPSQAAATQLRLDENLALVHAELGAPAESRLARLLRRLGVPDLTVPVVSATPALRRSSYLAVTIAVLFALSAASNQTAVGAERVIVFLTLAPLIPLAGVALSFGRGVDPTHDLVLAAPRDTFRVFLARATTVFVASVAVLVAAALLLPAVGAWRFAWLLPALGVTSLTMALSPGRDPRRVAAAVAACWCGAVIVGQQVFSAEAAFGAAAQAVAAAVACAGAFVLWRRSSLLEAAQ